MPSDYLKKSGWLILETPHTEINILKMINRLFLMGILIGLFSKCSRPSENATAKSVDSLSRQVRELKEKYKPGLGEIMAGIQMHHAKLWFAANNNNWKLSNYEIGEIKEMMESAQSIETDRPEIKNMPMIFPAIDSVTVAIQQQNSNAFKSSFVLLTNTCNSCHRISQFDFNVITLPSAPPVTNQDFKVH